MTELSCAGDALCGAGWAVRCALVNVDVPSAPALVGNEHGHDWLQLGVSASAMDMSLSSTHHPSGGGYCHVELPGIEPGSSGAESGLLRVQFA